jgi:CRP/FNR family transcriptional regulator, polysaccharide utilization system transcription regulator
MNSIECIIPMFNELTDEQINSINSNSFIIHHKKNEILIRQDLPISQLVYIKSGLVKIYKESSAEKIHILKIANEGNFIGILSVFSGNQYHYSASALEECDIVYTDIKIIKGIIAANGNYALHLMKLISDNGLMIFEKLISITQKQIPGRVAESLLYFSQVIYKNDSFYLPFTRQDFADLIGATKETISRTLAEFKNDRLIEIEDKKVTIKSFDLVQILSKVG